MVCVCPSFRKAFPFMRNARGTGRVSARVNDGDATTVRRRSATNGGGTRRAGFPVGRKRMSVRRSQTARVSGQSAQTAVPRAHGPLRLGAPPPTARFPLVSRPRPNGSTVVRCLAGARHPPTDPRPRPRSQTRG